MRKKQNERCLVKVTTRTYMHSVTHARTHALYALSVRAHTGTHTVNVAMLSSIMHRHFMFMQFTGQDRAMDPVDVSLAHNERIAFYKPITDRAQT